MVGAEIKLLASRLFRRHVARRTNYDAEVFASPQDAPSSGIAIVLRDAEVEYLCAAARIHHNIFGFQVTVCDAFCVRGAQRIQNLRPDSQNFLYRNRALRQSSVGASGLRSTP